MEYKFEVQHEKYENRAITSECKHESATRQWQQYCIDSECPTESCFEFSDRLMAIDY